MTQEQQTVLMLRGLISSIPPDMKEALELMQEKLKPLRESDEDIFIMAITLIAAEKAAEA